MARSVRPSLYGHFASSRNRNLCYRGLSSTAATRSSHRCLPIWCTASRTAAGEIFNIPLNGEYIDVMIKIAAETAIAQTISVTITVKLRGANIPKLIKKATSQDVTTINKGVRIGGCTVWRYI